MPSWHWNDNRDTDPFAKSPPAKVEERRSRLRLDEPQTFIDKLAVNIFIVFLGPGLILLLYLKVADALKAQPLLQGTTVVLAELLAAFCLLAMIYVWFKPPWFKKLYLYVESKFVVALVTFGVIVVWIVAAAIVHLWC